MYLCSLGVNITTWFVRIDTRGFSLVRDWVPMSTHYADTLLHIDFYFTRVIYWKTEHNKRCIETKFILIICRYYKIEHCCKYSGWKYFDIIPRKRIKYIGFRKKSFRLQKCFDWKSRVKKNCHKSSITKLYKYQRICTVNCYKSSKYTTAFPDIFQ